MSYEKIIDAAGELLKNSELGKLSHITSDWAAINWKTAEGDTEADAQVNLSKPDVIVLYPALAKRSAAYQPAALLREFGISVFTRHATPLAKRTWEEKLCLPEAAQVSAVQQRLKALEYPTYEAIVESFTTAMDRYVALNICNALIVPQMIRRAEAVNLDIYAWGSTKDYASLKRSHRIVPLVHAYGSRKVAECPGEALAELLANQLRSIRESSVASAFRRVIVETFNLCR